MIQAIKTTIFFFITRFAQKKCDTEKIILTRNIKEKQWSQNSIFNFFVRNVQLKKKTIVNRFL